MASKNVLAALAALALAPRAAPAQEPASPLASPTPHTVGGEVGP